MTLTKIRTINKKRVITLAQFITLVGVGSLAPLFLNQLVTGPVVNAALFIAVVILGPQRAILVGLIPSSFALSVGLLPVVLAPMIPFIMIGNTILVLLFGYLWKRNYWAAVFAASFLKFIFLALSSSIVMDLVLKKELASKVALIMSWPQFLTAITGGFIAYLLLRTLKIIK